MPDDDDTLRLAIAQAESTHVRAALATLPAAQRDALELAYFGDLSHTEIARQLNLPVGTIKSRIRMGLDRLRGALGLATPGTHDGPAPDGEAPAR
jgi:RNA polymerase sigma-70 factor (ECF subfamily)